MNIAVIGSKEEFDQIRQSQEGLGEAIHIEDLQELKDGNIVFDFTILNNLDRISKYGGISNAIIFLNTVLSTLDEVVGDAKTAQCHFAGFNGLPTFFKSNLEISVRREDKHVFYDCLNNLNLQYSEVIDRVGMVSSRVVAMIINEAFYTVEEGTASKSDIDSAMKLGTNYPYGPFEWAGLIGLTNLFNLMTTLFLNTGDSRYRVCDLLRKEQLSLVQ